MESNKPIQLPQTRAIIKSAGLRQELESLQTGSHVTSEFILNFPSIFEPEDFGGIPSLEYIKSWEVVTPATLRDGRLPQVKNRATVKPVWNDDVTESVMDDLIKSRQAFAMATATHDRVQSSIRSNQPALEGIMSAFTSSNSNVPLDVLRTMNIGTDISYIHNDRKFSINDFYGSGKQYGLSYGDAEDLLGFFNTGKNNGLDFSKFGSGNVAGVSLKDEMKNLSSFLTGAEESKYASTIFSGYQTNIFGDKNVSTDFFNTSPTYTDIDYQKYQSQIGSKYGGTVASFIGDNLVDTLGLEPFNNMVASIDSAASELGYRHGLHAKKETDSSGNKIRYGEYEDDVFTKAISYLEKENPTAFNYVHGLSGLFEHEELELHAEMQDLLKETNPVQARDAINQKREEKIRQNMVGQLRAVYDTYKEDRNDYRSSLAAGSTRASTEGFEASEIDNMYNDRKQFDRIIEDNEKTEKRLKRTAFEEVEKIDEKTGETKKVLQLINNKAPRRPTDKMVMAIQERLQSGEAVPFTEIHNIQQLQDVDRLKQELALTNDLLQKEGLSVAEKTLLEKNLSSLSKQIEERESIISKSNKSYLLNMEGKSFQEAMSESWRAMIEGGQQEVEAARIIQKQEAEKIRAISKEKVEQVSDLHGLSRKNARGLRDSLSNTELSFSSSIDQTIERLYSFGLDDVPEQYRESLSTVVRERDKIVNTLLLAKEGERHLRNEYGVREFSVAEYRRLDPMDVGIKDEIKKDDMFFEHTIHDHDSPGEKAKKEAQNRIIRQKRYFQQVKEGLNSVYINIPMIGGYIDEAIDNVNLSNHLAHQSRLEGAKSEYNRAGQVIKNNGYDPVAMGSTLAENDSLYQIGITKEQYNKYYKDPSKIDEDILKVGKHKVLVESKKGLSNVTSWIEAERNGHIVSGGYEDTVGYKVKVSPDQKIAYLTQPAIKVSDLTFGDVGISNNAIINATESGLLDVDVVPQNLVIDKNPNVSSMDTDFITLRIDETTRELFKENVWDEKIEGYVRNDIDAIFNGDSPRGYSITPAMLQTIHETKAEWDEIDTRHKMFFSEMESKNEDIFNERKALVDRGTSLRTEYNRIKEQITQLDRDRITASKEMAAKIADQIATLNEDLSAIEGTSKANNELIQELSKTLTAQLEDTRKANAVYTKGSPIEGFGLSDEILSMHKEREQQDIIKEKAFGQIKEMQAEKEAKRLGKVAEWLETIGVDPNDVVGSTNTIKLERQEFIDNFLQDKSDNASVFNKRLSNFMGSQLTHIDPDNYGTAAVAMLEMFNDASTFGKEYDLTSEHYAMRTLDSVSSGEAFEKSMLTKAQLADYNQRIADFDQMGPLERLQQVIFEDMRRHIMKEYYSTPSIEPASRFEHAVTTTYDTLAQTLGRSVVSPSMVLEDILDNEDADYMPKGIGYITLDEVSKILDRREQVSSVVRGLDGDEFDFLENMERGFFNDIEHYESTAAFREFQQEDTLGQEWFRGEVEFQDDYERQVAKINERGRYIEAYDNYADSKLEEARSTKGVIYNKWLEGHIEDRKEFLQADKAEQIAALKLIVSGNTERRASRKVFADAMAQMFDPIDMHVERKDLDRTINQTVLALQSDSRWTSLVEGGNPYYKNVIEQMNVLREGIANAKGTTYTNHTLDLANQFKDLRTFATVSLVNPELASEMVSIRNLSSILGHGELANKAMENATENLLSQMLTVAESEGQSLSATIKVPGQDYETAVEIRRRKDGALEAYSKELQQGFIVNESGQGATATARTDATRAYQRTNNIAAIETASKSHMPLRVSVPTHEMSKRKGNAMNISNITSNFVDSIQFAKDGAVMMGYDIETTMTGAKHLSNVIQPIDIYAEKFQFDSETGELIRDKEGRSAIKTSVQEFIEDADGNVELVNRPIERHSSFSALIALNDESKNLIEDLADDSSRLTIRFGNNDALHIASIADRLEWKSNMTEPEIHEFNRKKNEFIAERMKGKSSDITRVKKDINNALEEMRFLSNVAKYSMPLDERGNPLARNVGALETSNVGAFELFSKNQSVSSYDSILDTMADAYRNNITLDGVDNRFMETMFTEQDGKVVRAVPDSPLERTAVLRVQQKQTEQLIEAAQKAAEVLDSKEKVAEFFGDEIKHFGSDSEAIKAFRQFTEADDVVAILGSNTEKADNVTLLKRMIQNAMSEGNTKDGLVEVVDGTSVFKGVMDKLTKDRNTLLNETLSEITGEYQSKFTINPKAAESFRNEIEKKQASGANINAYLNKKKNIVVSDLSEALNYLPMLTNESVTVSPTSELVKSVDNQLSEMTHLFESIKSRDNASLNPRDKELLAGFDGLTGVSYDLDSYEIKRPTEAGMLKDLFERLSVIDQQVLARSMYPELKSLSNESLMTARGVDISTAHASNVDVQSGISILEDLVRDSYRAMDGDKVEFEGVKAVIDALGITKDMEDINEAQRLREGDFVFLREKYDKQSAKPTTSGQVGVYRIDAINDDLTGMNLTRYTMGSDGMIPDTSVPTLNFKEANNALFENEVVNKIRFISDENDSKVFAMGEQYVNDITRQHFDSTLSSPNSYYIQQHQLNAMANMFEGNPLFDMGNGASLIGASNEHGMIPINDSPVDRLESIGNQYNAIMNSETFTAVKNSDGLLEFNVGDETLTVKTPSGRSKKPQTVNLLGTNVEAAITPTEIDGEKHYSVQLNPNGNVSPENLSEGDINTIRNIYQSRNSPSESQKFFVPEITKEHAASLSQAQKFNDTELGRQTRALMDDVTALESIGEISSDAKTNIISAWNQAIRDQADELGAYRETPGVAALENIQYTRRPTESEFNELKTDGARATFTGSIDKATINTSTPIDAVNSINRLSQRISRDLDVDLSGTENRMTYIANQFVLPSLESHGLLPEGYGEQSKGLVSLEKMGLDISNHAAEFGIQSPVKTINHVELAELMDSNGMAKDLASNFRKTYIDPKMDVMSDNKTLEFEAARENLERSLNEGRYIPGMNMSVPTEPNVDGAFTLSEMRSKDFFKGWSVDDLIDTADSLAGKNSKADLRMNTKIYGEIAKRASGGATERVGIDPNQIIASGDAERMRAAEHLGWIEEANTRINGKPAYRAVEDLNQHVLTFSNHAGMRIGDMQYSDLLTAISGKYSPPDPQWNAASYQQMQMLQDVESRKELGYDHTINRKTHWGHVRGIKPEGDLSAANEELIRQAESYERPSNTTASDQIADSVTGGRQEPQTVADFSSRINNVGSDGQPLLQSSSVPQSDIPLERVIEPPTEGRILSDAEAFIDNTKSSIRDKMDSFLHGSSGGKWVAGLGVAAAALYAVNSMGGPLKLEDRPQGHGVKGLAGAPEDDQRTQRETQSIQVDTSGSTYVNSGDKGYTIQARGRAGSNIDTGQLQNAVSGMQGASSVNVNIRDDRSSIDSQWLEGQFSNYINRGYAGE